MPIPPTPTDAQRAQYFKTKNPDPPPRTFELGLVLGGTVSAGAYTGGALDALTEALDAWYAAHNGKPPHDVKIPVIGGASGGGVCATLLALMSNKDIPHARDKNDPGPNNLFWDVFVNRFDVHHVLDVGDLAGAPYAISLLNAGMIDGAVENVVRYAAEPGTVERPWIAHPVRIALTQGNLRGIPYKITDIPPIGTYTGDAFVRHDDFGWFAVPNWVGTYDGEPAHDKRPDEFWVAHNPVDGLSKPFSWLGDWARATGAFPMGFSSRPLQRPAEHYLYRPFARPTEGGQPDIQWPTPDWDVLDDVKQDGTYHFRSVDGGTYNNDPVAIVHTALAGIVGPNPRGRSEANRAMFLIDALASPPDGKLCPVPTTGPDPNTHEPGDDALTNVAVALVGAFIAESRYRTADLDLFADPAVFSRFQLVPHRIDGTGKFVAGERAVAGATLYAFGGWGSPAFRVHDYLLGRANMIEYLRTELLLAGDNPVFEGWNDTALRQQFACDADGNSIAVTDATPKGSYFLPIIPTEISQPGQPEWPNEKFNPDDIRDQVEARLEGVLGLLRTAVVPGFGGWLLGLAVVPGIAGTLADKLIKWYKDDLATWGLAPAPPADPVPPPLGLNGGGSD